MPRKIAPIVPNNLQPDQVAILDLQVSMLPSLNQKHGTTRQAGRRGMYIRPEYRAAMEQTRQDARDFVLASRWQTFADDRYIVYGSLPFWLPDRGHGQDEDNIWKPLMDELAKAGVFWNDKLIEQNAHQRIWTEDPRAMLAQIRVWRFCAAGYTEPLPVRALFDKWMESRYKRHG